MNKRLIFSFGIFVLLIGIVSSQVFSDTNRANFYGSTSNYQYTAPTFNSYYSSDSLSTYWPYLYSLENDQCEASTDFVVMIRPGSCTPPVVRSDLLEEQNVPVFCQLDAIRINPLIDVSSIKSISFKGQYPEGVAGISFHPARAAIRSYNTLLGSPLMNNIGYVVIILNRNKVEDDMPDWVFGNLTATVYYDAEKAYGTGQSEYYLPSMSDSDWQSDYKLSSFWQGRGFLRVNSIENGQARISLYTDKDDKFTEVTLKEGAESDLVYFPGFYCRAGLKVRLNKVVTPEDSALLNIDGDELWVRKGSKVLNNRCTVTKLDALHDGTGNIELSCPRETVKIGINNKVNATFVIQDSAGKKQNKVFRLGDEILKAKDSKNNDVSLKLIYVGKIPQILEGDGLKDSEGEMKNFALIAGYNPQLSSTELNDVAKKVDDISSGKIKLANNNLEGFVNEMKKSLGTLSNIKNMYALVEGLTTVSFTGLTTDTRIGFGKLTSTEKPTEVKNNPITEEYYNKSMESVNELLNLYPQEKGELDRFGEIALWEQIRISELLGKQTEKAGLLKRFIDTYPDSKFIDYAIDELSSLGVYNMGESFSNVYINNEYHHISVRRMKAITKDDKVVSMNIAGQYYDFSEGDRIYLEGDAKAATEKVNKKDYLVVDKIGVSSVTFSSYEAVMEKKSKKWSDVKKESFSMAKEETKTVLNKNIMVRNIKVKEIAYVSLIPEVQDTSADANFTFRIGIEKRAIDLSPKKTQQMIDNLNDTIKKWEDINKKLGNLIKGWKGACFATSSVLMLKSMVSGFNGETMARQKVMQAYRQKCEREFSGMSHTQCYNELSKDIDNDVKEYTQAIQDINKDIDRLQEGYKKNGGIFGTDVYVDGEAAFKKWQEDHKGESATIKLPGENKTVEVDFKNFRGWNDYKAYMLSQKLDGKVSDNVLNYVTSDMNSQLYAAYRVQQDSQTLKSVQDILPSELKDSVSVLSKNQKLVTWSGKSLSYSEMKDLMAKSSDNDVLSQFSKDDNNKKTPVQIVSASGELYLATLASSNKGSTELSESGFYKITKADNGKIIIGKKETKIPVAGKYTFRSGGSCVNSFVSPKIRYYEVEPNIRMPAIVPFDLKKGWYVRVSQAIGGITSAEQKGYQASGAVQFFYICNVGSNGREENMGGDDICQSFDINSYDKVSTFGGCPSMTASEVRRLAENAQQALRQAAEQYGSKTVNILGQAISTGMPMSDDTNMMECQDFMSPEDCKIMFNVCDPVICPASRCNLGGAYPVSDVVQTGIIGSIFLCLPNFKEGVMVPVCLTGIHAGLEAYVSILNSEAECLKTSLKTGEHVGICDEVTSIYLCEFFWRQLSPVLNILIPKMIEMAYGQNVRGGGEYLTVAHAWDTMEKSISYFKDNYAENAFKAFQSKNVEEAGTEVCKAFVGSSFPTSANALDSLLEPESPYQFYAQFSEIAFTDVTVPATSQYKIYYHIFAGKDRGAQFVIYLQDPPSSSYYATQGRIMIKTGFIPVGEEADEAIDFTGPAGYKELCVVINAKEECGFRQVSTDFGVNYLRDKYVTEQANQTNIDSEKECISGSPSALGMANLNVQAGLEESTQPNIALRGVTRVCSTNNPGISVGNSSRWKSVGNCGNSNIQCWLDTQSVKEEVKRVSAVENTLQEMTGGLKSIDNEGNTLLENDTINILNGVSEWIKGLNNVLKNDMSSSKVNETIAGQILKLKRIENFGYLNSHKAEAIYLQGEIYRVVVEKFFDSSLVISKPVVPTATQPSEGGSGNVDSPTDNVIPNEKGFVLHDGDGYGGIWLDGEDTGFFLEGESSNKFFIWKNSHPVNARVGTIINGVITFNDKANGKEILDLEKYYKFKNGKFVLKAQTTTSSPKCSLNFYYDGDMATEGYDSIETLDVRWRGDECGEIDNLLTVSFTWEDDDIRTEVFRDELYKYDTLVDVDYTKIEDSQGEIPSGTFNAVLSNSSDDEIASASFEFIGQ